MIKRKRKIKIYGKINLYETSVVGIPAYPDAHFNNSFSLIKSLSSFMEDNDGNLKIKYKEGERMEKTEEDTKKDVKKQETEDKPKEPEDKPDKPEDKEKTEEKKEEEKKAETEKSTEIITNFMAKAIKEAVKDIDAERALVEKEKSLKNKSIGELTLEMMRTK